MIVRVTTFSFFIGVKTLIHNLEIFQLQADSSALLQNLFSSGAVARLGRDHAQEKLEHGPGFEVFRLRWRLAPDVADLHLGGFGEDQLEEDQPQRVDVGLKEQKAISILEGKLHS